MKTTKNPSWMVALAVVALICMVWIQFLSSSNELEEKQAPHSERVKDAARPVDSNLWGVTEQQAVRLSPRDWIPPAVFAEPGLPAPQVAFRRGANARRYYASPVSHEVVPVGNPVALAKTPKDGRLHLLPEEIDVNTLIARRMVFNIPALDAVISGQSSQIIVPTVSDEVLTLDISSFKTRSSHSHTLFGRVSGEEATSDVQLVYHDGVIHGTVARYALAKGSEHLEYRILSDGHMMVREIDVASMTEGCGNGDHTETAEHACSSCSECKGAQSAEEALEEITGQKVEVLSQESDGEIAGDTSGWTTVDVVVGYGRGAREDDGGYAQIEARILSAIDRMTTAFANSLITNTEVNLLGTIEDPDYVYPGAAAGSQVDELNDLNNSNDGSLDAVSNYATQLGSDFVAFIPRRGDGSAGIAHRPGRFSITARNAMTSSHMTFAHELGHNLGCYHSWGDTSQGYHSSYGWRMDADGSDSTTNDRVRTIMAYNGGWGSRVAHYANPNVNWNGAPTGAPYGHDVRTDTKGDQRYFQNGTGFSNGVYGFDGNQAALAAYNADTILNGTGGNSHGAAYASNRSTRASNAVISPISASRGVSGQPFEVFFIGGDHTDTATIDLFKGGGYQSTIATGLNPATDRAYTWDIPTNQAAGEDYQIRVTLNHGHGGSTSFFSSNFTIILLPAESVLVTSPNGGESYETGQTIDITWASTYSGNVNIELLKNGSPHSVIAADVIDTGRYTWAIPASFENSSEYRILVEGVGPGASSDTSDGAFSIKSCSGFEYGMSGWVQITADDIDWTRGRGTTPSSSTGPSGASVGDHYLFVEATANNPAKVAIIYKDLDFSGINQPLMIFDYHMYGATMGSLFVEVSTDEGATWAESVWSLSGNQGNAWITSQAIDLGAYAGQTVRVRFRGVTGSNFTGDMAIDNICFEEGMEDGVMFADGGSFAVAENFGTSNIVVERFGSTEGAVSVAYQTSNGTAVNGSDYTPRSGTLSWADGDGAPKTIPISIINDSADEQKHETLFVTLSNPVGTGILGENPATLTITDNDNNPPTVDAGPNQLVSMPAEGVTLPVAGEVIHLDAGLDDGANNIWEDSKGLWNPTIDPAVAYLANAGSDLPGISSAYDYPGGLSGVGGCEGPSLQDLSLDTKPISIEIWFKPDVSASYPTNGQILWETGGTNGLGIFYTDGLVMTSCDALQGRMVADVSGMTDEFIQVVVTINPLLTSNNYRIYINGTLMQQSNRTDSDLCGGDGAGLGERGVNNAGGAGSGDAGTLSFDGKIAILRTYHDRILTAAEVMQNYESITDPGGATANLDGTITDAPGELITSEWTFVSGPAPVAFGNANAIDTTAYFSAEGVYTLRLTAHDGEAEVSDDVVITVGSPPAAYTTWVGGTFANAFIDSGTNSDPDGDGLLNFMEFAFGTDPTDPTAGSLSYVANGDVTKPGLPILESPGSGFRAVFIRRKDHVSAGLSYTVEFSADLQSWTASSSGLSVETGAGSSGDYEAVSVPFPATVPLQGGGNDTPQFFRVGVTMN